MCREFDIEPHCQGTEYDLMNDVHIVFLFQRLDFPLTVYRSMRKVVRGLKLASCSCVILQNTCKPTGPSCLLMFACTCLCPKLWQRTNPTENEYTCIPASQYQQYGEQQDLESSLILEHQRNSPFLTGPNKAFCH